MLTQINLFFKIPGLTFICCNHFVCRGQAEKEFKVEVEAIGKVRHKNLVGLVGYCAEGAQRYFPPAHKISFFEMKMRWKFLVITL